MVRDFEQNFVVNLRCHRQRLNQYNYRDQSKGNGFTRHGLLKSRGAKTGRDKFEYKYKLFSE